MLAIFYDINFLHIQFGGNVRAKQTKTAKNIENLQQPSTMLPSRYYNF